MAPARIGQLGRSILEHLAEAKRQFDPHRSARGTDHTVRPDDEPGLTTDQLAELIYGLERLNGDDWQREQSRARFRISKAAERLAVQGLVRVEDRSAFDWSPSGDIRRLERWVFLVDPAGDT